MWCEPVVLLKIAGTSFLVAAQLQVIHLNRIMESLKNLLNSWLNMFIHQTNWCEFVLIRVVRVVICKLCIHMCGITIHCSNHTVINFADENVSPEYYSLLLHDLFA